MTNSENTLPIDGEQQKMEQVNEPQPKLDEGKEISLEELVSENEKIDIHAEIKELEDEKEELRREQKMLEKYLAEHGKSVTNDYYKSVRLEIAEIKKLIVEVEVEIDLMRKTLK